MRADGLPAVYLWSLTTNHCRSVPCICAEAGMAGVGIWVDTYYSHHPTCICIYIYTLIKTPSAVPYYRVLGGCIIVHSSYNKGSKLEGNHLPWNGVQQHVQYNLPKNNFIFVFLICIFSHGFHMIGPVDALRGKIWVWYVEAWCNPMSMHCWGKV